LISKNSIETLKNSLDIVDTVSGYVQLKKSGANYKGLCPFHGEDTPSFVVSPAKGIYHCFGCQVGGDAIKFVMELEKLSYPETIEKLARENNITLEYDNNSHQKQNLDIIKETKEFYKKELEKNRLALKYLSDRGVYESSIEEFEIGFAPSSQETINFLKSKFFNINDAVELGVLGQGSSVYARFIDRIIFPIYTPNGAVTGFGGRTITNHQAKYVNSPQSKVFNKSKLLYGYSRAKESIYKKSQIIITEGYLDVIMLHQAGFKNATATLGTALTQEHVPLIAKANPKVLLAYDGDKAGLNAAYKASKIMALHSIDGGVVIFGEGIDPADMVKDKRVDELNLLFNKPKPFIEYILEFIIKSYDLNNPNEKQNALKEANEFLSSLGELMANEYKTYLSSLLNINSKFINIRPTYKQNRDNNNLYIDTAEATLIKTAVDNKTYIDQLTNSLEPYMFRYHQEEYNSMIQSDTNNPKLLNITLNNGIKTYKEDEFYKQIDYFMVRFYDNKLLEIKNSPDIGFKEKNFKMREIREIIQKLKKRD
jgi:DNA primase